MNRFTLPGLLKITLNFFSFYKSSPVELHTFRVGDADGQVVVKSVVTAVTRKKQKSLRKKGLGCIALLILLFLQLCLPHTLKDSPTYGYEKKAKFDKVLGGFAFTVLFISTVNLNLFRNRPQEIALYLNGLLQEGAEVSDGSQISYIDLLNLGFIPGIWMTTAVFPVGFVAGLHWNDPCRSSLIGYFAIPKCHVQGNAQDFSGLSKSVEVVVFIANITMWTICGQASTFSASVLLIIAMQLVKQSVKRLRRHLEEAKSSDVTKYFQEYRKIQLFGMLGNSVQQESLGVIMIGTICTFCTTFVSLVRTETQKTGPMAPVVLGIAVFDAAFVLLAILGELASVHEESTKTLEVAKALERKWIAIVTKRRSQERKWRQRFRWSCPNLKIKFGNNNFVEKLTPLQCLACAIDMTAHLLLLDKK